MARNIFGGTAADAAENESGGRLVSLKGRVYLTEESPDEVKDLLDLAGNEMKDGLLTDSRGMIPQFQGPDGVEQLWVDFNAGRVMLTPNDVGKRLQSHTISYDPHGAKQYTDIKLREYVPFSGAEVNLTNGRSWVTAQVEPQDSTGNVLQVKQGGRQSTRIRNDGCVLIDSSVPSQTPLVVGSKGAPADGYLILVTDDTADGAGEVFVVQKNGRITTKGDAVVKGNVYANNIGTARVFSGTDDPRNAGVTPRVGDVWINYGN